MWVKFNLEGLKLQLKIEKYESNQNIDGKWTDVSFRFEFKDIIRYLIIKKEILLSYEVDILRNYMENLLNNKLDKEERYECIEPDLEFIFKPKYDGKRDSNILEEKRDFDIGDIDMKINVNLWDEGLTCNYFSTSFGRKEIEIFYLYLSLITSKISINDNRIKELLKFGIIYDNVE